VIVEVVREKFVEQIEVASSLNFFRVAPDHRFGGFADVVHVLSPVDQISNPPMVMPPSITSSCPKT
jgi:hypothetical protein